MNYRSLFYLVGLFLSLHTQAQPGWFPCTAPNNLGRVDDIFMLNTRVGYAVSGYGFILKTTDGKNWNTLLNRPRTYFRSVEFINEQKGFIGGFSGINSDSVLLTTNDGGATWTSLVSRLDNRAKSGICGLAAPDANTIYGCGNWYEENAYIIKSTDGGVTWSFIDMSAYATSLIDMHFINKDVGFATGKGLRPDMTAVILYTTDGGQTWTYKYKNIIPSEYCWKIQRLDNQVYFAAIEDDQSSQRPKMIKSIDGGMTWFGADISQRQGVYIQGIGFIDRLLGWAGGSIDSSFESRDGGSTWRSITSCPGMNRVFKVNDTLMYASGLQIWRYSRTPIDAGPLVPDDVYAYITYSPNPANSKLSIRLTLKRATRSFLALLDNEGRNIHIIDNKDRTEGIYDFTVPSWKFPAGTYTLLMRTHSDHQAEKVIFTR